MKFLDTLRAKRDELIAEREAAIAELEAASAVAVTEARTLTDEETAVYTTVRARIADVDGRLAPVDERIAELTAIEERTALANLTPTSKPIVARDIPHAVELRYMRPAEVRDASKRILERDGRDLAPFQLDAVDRILRSNDKNLDGDSIARRMIATMDVNYRSAFAKLMTNNGHLINSDEARAMEVVNDIEQRAASSTSAAGGYGVPVLIDPTIILTSGAGAAPVLALATIKTITTDTWKGVSSAGVTWSFDTEGSAVSDDAATLGQPTVSVHEARGFIPFSVRIGMDYPGFEAEMRSLLEQGYLDLLALKTVIATGTNEPWGIFTAIDQTAGSEVAVTTDGALGAVDFRKVWAALPERYRSRATWLHSVTVDNQLRSFSSSGTGSEYIVNLRDEYADTLMKRPVAITDYAPAFTGTTGAANITVVGDFSNYVVAQRAGMSVELVPHLFDVTDNRPTLQRGWLAWARVGADSVNDNAFRLLQNT